MGQRARIAIDLNGLADEPHQAACECLKIAVDCGGVIGIDRCGFALPTPGTGANPANAGVAVGVLVIYRLCDGRRLHWHWHLFRRCLCGCRCCRWCVWTVAIIASLLRFCGQFISPVMVCMSVSQGSGGHRHLAASACRAKNAATLNLTKKRGLTDFPCQPCAKQQICLCSGSVTDR